MTILEVLWTWVKLLVASWSAQILPTLQAIADYLDAHQIQKGFLFLLLGIFLAEIYSVIKRAITTRRELRRNNRIVLRGKDWFAAWQASTDNVPNINTEKVTIRQRGGEVWMWNTELAKENPKGTFFWSAKLEFSLGETLMGLYYPRKGANISSRGIIYYTYDSPRKVLLGKWVGKAIDGSLCNGFTAIAKDRETARRYVELLIEQSKNHPVNIIATGILLRSLDTPSTAITFDEKVAGAVSHTERSSV